MGRGRYDNRGRGRDNFRRGGNGGGGRRGGRRNRGYPRQSAESGNKRERIAVESGYLVFIDQFMLANPQFIDRVVEMIDASPEDKNRLIQDYGGCVVEVEPGTYRIERDPFAFSIVVHPEGYNPDVEALPELATASRGHVFVDTRCLAMIDRELLDDSSLLQKYQELWFNGEDKACRDLLRDNGGAVRYGFQRQGDELGIYSIPAENVICLWPDLKDGAPTGDDEPRDEGVEAAAEN
jgi:hypothetical protein